MEQEAGVPEEVGPMVHQERLFKTITETKARFQRLVQAVESSQNTLTLLLGSDKLRSEIKADVVME